MCKRLIICAAIRFEGKVFRGHRHTQCYHAFDGTYHKHPYKLEQIYKGYHGKIEDGFVTSENIFVGREEALVIARAAGQVDTLIGGKILTSEDLY